MANNYDSIAGSYDFLSRLVFGKAIPQSQTCLLPYIAAGSKVLIVGGGTGLILEEISRIHPSGLEIVYVDSSARMIRLAKKRNTGSNNIQFLYLPIEAYAAAQTFDVIVTPYLFDNFSTELAEQNFHKLHHILQPKGKWLFVDFYINKAHSKLWQKALLKLMYIFFKRTANIAATELVDMAYYFRQSNYTEIYLSSYYGGFIRSVVWERGE